MTITRHFVRLPGRSVHYRRCGSGPALVMIHQSPQDSSEFEPLMAELAAHFTVFAPDTPGYGLSDPLAAPDSAPGLDQFVDALLAWLDAVGIGRAAFYGLHSGATILTRLAARRPDRVARLVVNGLALLDAAERRDILARYLPRFEPRWDGSHLTWLWARLREQALVFPWYRGHIAAEPAAPGDPLAVRERYLHTFLRAGDDYRTAYRAVFEHPLEPDIAVLACPTVALIEPGDPLTPQLARLSAPAVLRLQTLGGHDEIAAQVIAACAGLDAPAPPPPPMPAEGPCMIAAGDGAVRLKRYDGGPGRPLLLLHDRGGTAETLERVATPLRDRRPVLVPDLPLHGASHGFAPDLGVVAAADALDAMCAAIGADEIDVIAVGNSVAPGGALAARARRVRHFLGINPLMPDKALPAACPIAATVDEDGGQLQAAWRLARGLGLPTGGFAPARALLEVGTAPLLAEVQTRAVALLQHIRATQAPLVAQAIDPAAFRAPDITFASRAGMAEPAGPARPLPDALPHWARILSQALESS